jgi:predicted ArsR family transcriptional regulator
MLYNPFMQYTRKQIIDYVRIHQTASIPELSRILNLTVGNIRHHIKALEKQKIIKESGNLLIKGKGRPTKQYNLTKDAEDHNLDNLAGTLIKVLIRERTEDSEYTINTIAEMMIRDFKRSQSSIQQLNQVIQWLDERHYQAHWEASPTGPRVIIDHCPYSAIRSSTPEICQIDNSMLAHLTGSQVYQICKRGLDYQEPKQCIFAIQAEQVAGLVN